jgi:2-polyprenyl-3-methyl-5-hydroxy-6-metoxy-1,4-benzoquinol methylase
MMRKDERFDESYYREWLCDRYVFNEERKAIVRFYLKMVLSRKQQIQRILDIGCGYGYFLKVCLEAGIPEVYGVDISTAAIKKSQALEKAKVNQIDFSKEKSSFDSDFFDVITAFDVAEHVEDEDFFLKEIYRVLKKEGLLLLITPNADSWPRNIYMKLIYGKDDPTHINVQGWRYWKRLLEEIGFNHTEVKGSLLHGFPPTTTLRGRLGKWSTVKPILLPILFGSRILDRLFLFATK